MRSLISRLPRIVSRVRSRILPTRAVAATIGHGSILHPESRVENHLGDKTAIQVGANSHVRGELLVFGHGGKIEIGDYCYIGEQSRIWSASSIKIESRVLIAHNVTIMDNLTHPLNAEQRHEHFKHIIQRGHPKQIDLREREVLVEADAWIGCMCVVLPGVRIGRGAIVGAGSVVTRDVPAWAVVAGNPAAVVRRLEATPGSEG